LDYLIKFHASSSKAIFWGKNFPFDGKSIGKEKDKIKVKDIELAEVSERDSLLQVNR
jgi:hypothetical protein